MTGNIELVAGGFTTSDGDMTILSDFFDDGYLEFTMTDFSAVMAFELAFLPGFNLAEFTARLPNIPLGAIAIAGLLEFGPVLELTFPISVTLNSPVTIRTGFTLSAPSDVRIYLNMSHPESSYTTGFSESQVMALPFTADAKGLSLNVTIGFKPQLVLSADLNTHIFNASADGGIGVYLDLPQLGASVGIVNGVDDHCEPTTSDASNDLIRVDSSVTYAGGAEWDAAAHLLGLDYKKGEDVPWLSNTTILPTQCLMWDAEESELVKATPAATKTSSSGSGSSGTDQSQNSSNRITCSIELLYAILLLVAILPSRLF